MGNEKITFIVPALKEMRVTRQNHFKQNKIFTLPYIGLLMLAAFTPGKYEVDILNEHIDPLDADSIDADLVGITVMTPMAPRAYEIADRLRDRGKVVVLGGVHPTYLQDEALLHADSIVQGEAEITWPELLRDFENGRLKKIYSPKALFDLSLLPFPRRDLVTRYNSPVEAVQATRGCVYHCDFCSVHKFYDNRFRMRPVEHVIEEIKQLKGKIITFVDDNITGSHEWAKELFSAMIPLKKKWVSMASISIANDKELLSLAVKSGCMGFFIGLESTDEFNLEASKKYVNRSFCKDYKKVIEKMHSMGLGISAGTVYGFDRDTKNVFKNTLDFVKEVGINLLQVAPLTPFPGTNLFQKFKKQGRDLDTDWSQYNFYNVPFTPKQMSRQELLDGMNYVRNGFYSNSSIFNRVLRNAPKLGMFSTIVNFYLNYSYRSNQRAGFRFPP